MSQPIHTPGPCTTGKSEHEPDRIYIYGEVGPNKPRIAIAEFGLSYGQDVAAENAANARLLAAAYNAFDSAARKLGVNAVLLAEGLQRGGIADLISALEQAREHIDGEIDVVDGDYGVPAPNKAMSLAQEIDAALAKVKGGAA